jgi:hypothetical protein
MVLMVGIPLFDLRQNDLADAGLLRQLSEAQVALLSDPLQIGRDDFAHFHFVTNFIFLLVKYN